MARSTISSIIICLVILALDATAGILGIEAEISQYKVYHKKFMIFDCRESSQKAFKLGLSAAIILALAHIIGNLLAGCNIICICSAEELQRSSTRLMAAASSTLSWIVFAIGFVLLMMGAMVNNRSRASCGLSFAHHKLLTIGGVLCFVHGVLFAAYYTSAAAERDENERQHHNPKPSYV